MSAARKGASEDAADHEGAEASSDGPSGSVDGAHHDDVAVSGAPEEPDEDAVVAEIVEVVDDDPPIDDADLATARAQRDEYLEALQRVKAEFDNFRKRTEKQRSDMAARAAEDLVFRLLPVLDACDAAIAQGASDVEPISKVLFDSLHKDGLERIGEAGEPFDPTVHEAVMQEPAGEDDDDEQVVVEVLRGGFKWKGAVLRTAMVKVRG